MGITVGWFNNDNTAILRKTEGRWTWEEFESSYDDVNALIRSVSHTVHVIVDYSAAAAPPAEGPLKHYAEVWSKHPENIGAFIIIAADMFLEQMGKTFVSTIAKGQTEAFYVKSMQEAETKLAELLAAG